MANTLKFSRKGAVGFIDWLDFSARQEGSPIVHTSVIERVFPVKFAFPIESESGLNSLATRVSRGGHSKRLFFIFYGLIKIACFGVCRCQGIDVAPFFPL